MQVQKAQQLTTLSNNFLRVGGHPAAISSWLFYHCEALGLLSHWPVCALA